MSLKDAGIPANPAGTIRGVRAAFPKGNRATGMRDEFGSFYEEDAFASFYVRRGRPGEAAESPRWLGEVEAVRVLHRVWLAQ